MAKPKLISMEGSRTIFKTNFSGDPERDNFGNDMRKLNLIIPTEAQAREMEEAGFNVKWTKPRDDAPEDFEPTPFVSVNINYETEWPPKIYLVSGNDGMPQLLDVESVSVLDNIYISNVDVVLNPYFSKKTGRWSLYVKTMYVTQDLDDDPFAAKYRNRAAEAEPDEDDEEIPFN